MNFQKADYDAIIVGAGIAGCSAAIQLQKCGLSVLLLDKRKAVGDKLCGEFVSSESRDYLKDLGVLHDVLEIGAVEITRLSIADSKGWTLRADLASPALGMSRFALDSVLLKEAVRLGVDYTDGSVVTQVSRIDNRFEVATDSKSYAASLVFGAYGKASKLDDTLGRPKWSRSWIAFKAHYRGSRPSSGIEIFALNGGYVGISPIEDGLENACFIVDRQAFKCSGGKVDQFIENAFVQNPSLAKRLSGLERISHYIACSEMTFGEKSCFQNGVCMIGDTAGMIAPICGDGISMAMQSAMVSAGFAKQYLSGDVSFKRFQHKYTKWWRSEYAVRLFIGHSLQNISRSPVASSLAVRTCCVFPAITKKLIASTRGQSAFLSAHLA